MSFCTIQNRPIEYVRLPSAHPRNDAPAMVFLHEGLGSLAMWRDFPKRVADASGCEVIVYSRHGYGRSASLPEKRCPDYMHREALDTLPRFLDRLGVDRPILFGHSDGGSIALIHAGGASRPVAGLVVVAPHVIVEDVTISGIEKACAAYAGTDLGLRLARYHDEAAAVFRSWLDIWLDPAFRDWNIEEYLPRITCPVLAIQGEDDEYASMDQLKRIDCQAADVELLELADCRHSPHRDQPAAVIAAVTEFVERLLRVRSEG
jgi:pimeloyl-ACP methyl ester carboxylesterase